MLTKIRPFFVVTFSLSIVALKLLTIDIVTSLEYCKHGNYHRDCVPHNCTSDIQCQASSPGPYSRCRREFFRCECFHRERQGVPYNGTCLPVKTNGEVCTSHRDCLSIKGRSACLGVTLPNQLVRGICGCKDFKAYYHSELNECLQLQKREGAPCSVDIQCSHLLALGPLAKCDALSRKCRCWDTVGDGAQPTGWHDGRCYYSRAEHEPCDLREECVIGFHRNADCLRRDTVDNETMTTATVCGCPESESCEELRADPNGAAQFSANGGSTTRFTQGTISIFQLIFVLLINTFNFNLITKDLI